MRALDRLDGFRIINLGGGRPATVLEVVQALETALGRKARIDWQPQPPGDVSQTWADTSVAESYLDYRPHTSLSDGVERFVEWLDGREKESR